MNECTLHATVLVREFHEYLAGITAEEADEVLIIMCRDEIERVDLCNKISNSEAFGYSNIAKAYTTDEVVRFQLYDTDGDEVEATDEMAREALLDVYKEIITTDVSSAAQSYKQLHSEHTERIEKEEWENGRWKRFGLAVLDKVALAAAIAAGVYLGSQTRRRK